MRQTTSSERRTRSRGQSLAEFALAIPLFMLVFLGVAEGGYFVVSSTIVSHATHEGARLGVLKGKTETDLKGKVISAAAAVTMIAPGDISVCINGSCGSSQYAGRKAGDTLRVATTYTHQPLVSYVFPGVTWPANTQAELWVEQDA